jgi:2-polyprenyl-6-methoxyphenol hydroxylase-like FAD-dependent oxidoreductase
MQSASTPLNVFIVGAGPTGLVLACLCRRQGLRVRIVDKKSGPSTTSKAVGLQYRVSELLAAMGVVDRFLQRGSSPTPVNLYGEKGPLVRFDFNIMRSDSGSGAFSPRPIMIPQNETEAILAEYLAEQGVHVEWNTEFVERLENGDRVVSRIRDADGREQEVVSDWLVSCEGAHSTIRKQSGIEFGGKTYPLDFYLADVELEWPVNHNENHVWLHPLGAFAALPLPGKNVWRFMIEISQQRELYPGEATEDAIAKLIADRTDYDAGCIRRYLWLSQFRINCRMVHQYRQGRTFLAGDSAHIHSPTGGQGITTCVQDAANLSWKLGRVAQGAPDSLLDTYQEERLPHAEEVLRETDRTTTVFFGASPAMRMLRDWVVLPVLRTHFVQRRLFGKLAQLHVNYRGSSLSRTETSNWFSRPRRRGGDRAPDICFERGSDGASVTLFELLSAVRPIALLSPAAGGSSEKSRDLIERLRRLNIDAFRVVDSVDATQSGEQFTLRDIHGEFRRVYGLRANSLCLIRPDGHLGLVQQPFCEETLKQYLQSLCSPQALSSAFSLGDARSNVNAHFALPTSATG